MRKACAITLLLIIFSTMAPGLVGNVSAQEANGTSTNVNHAKWTIMIYLDADNNLDPFGAMNLQQIYEGFNKSSTSNVNVVVLLDRLNEGAWLYDVKNNYNESLGELDMGFWETLYYFVYNITSNSTYSSDHYMLIIWDHGLGWPGVCWDDSSGNYLTPHNVSNALKEALNGKKIDILGFDACLMGMIEICYELKDVADIVIGSEMLIPGYGWPYKELMQYVSNDPNVAPEDLSKFIVNQYVDYYSKVKPNFFVQLSAVNTSKIKEMAGNLSYFVGNLSDNINTYRGLISGARGASQQKFILGTAGVIFYTDLYKFADFIGTRAADGTLRELAFNLAKSIDEMIFAENHTRPQGNLDQKQYGLTVYFPPNKQSFIFKYVEYVPAFAETGWFDFLKTFYGVAS